MSRYIADYYLGANTPKGFYSYFKDSFSASDGWQVFIIKGGPGTGKSTLMKRICARAEQCGISFERIWCSSDPSSLDAVILPDQRRAIYDGTPPHVLEPAFPGVCEQTVNLCDMWDRQFLQKNAEEIIELSTGCSACHAQATRFLACASAFRLGGFLKAEGLLDNTKLDRAVLRLLRSLPAKRGSGKGQVSTRLLTAVTPEGVRFAGKNEYDTLCIADRYGAAAHELLRRLAGQLTDRGYDIVRCPCSQDSGRIEHIVVPEAGLLFSTSNDLHAAETTGRMIHAERFMTEEVSIQQSRRVQRQFLTMAAEEMAQALALHDRLEAFYRAAMDFSAVDALAENTVDVFFEGID